MDKMIAHGIIIKLITAQIPESISVNEAKKIFAHLDLDSTNKDLVKLILIDKSTEIRKQLLEEELDFYDSLEEE